MQRTKRFIAWALVAALIFMLPIAMQFTDEVQLEEAVAYGILFLIAGGFYELRQWLNARTGKYRSAFNVGLAGIFLLGWVSGAVGIIGSENNPVNLLYWAVFAVALIGSSVSRFNPRGMSYALFATAAVQILIPVFAIFVWPAKVSWGDAGDIGVFFLNSIFGIIFAVSGFLFSRAADMEMQN